MGVLLFDKVFTQQVLRTQQAIFLAGAKVREWAEILRQSGAGSFHGCCVPGRAVQCGFAGPGAFGRGRHAAVSHSGFDHHAVVNVQFEGSTHGADVVFQAFGDFLGVKQMTFPGAWDDDFFD